MGELGRLRLVSKRMMASRFQHCISIGPSREAILTKNSTLANLRLRVLKLNFLR
ncbi:hypothetical protein NC653_023346 [Populus alba x Populus x berolinensis]|uniref:Uncharacterized protein n=1 Tax=Populus alba x Populus x berolinensis TaxID=444605 RepID=A0AAD6MGY9_9ROSI|nr:hypothetical protein NC653_023346 [Populus alba x Populus x berolinensis]